MIPETVRELCLSKESVTSLMNDDLHLTPEKAFDQLVPQRKPSAISAVVQNYSAKYNKELDADVLEEDLEVARKCGKFDGTEPSKLFLKIFYHVLKTLDKDPRAGVVSPSLLGSTGVVPLTIMSIIPDIMRHYANLIVHAEKSIIIATNFWAASHASHIVTDALRELSRRRLEAGLPSVDVKILYDRGNVKQTVKNHLDVDKEDYSGAKVKIPKPEEVEGITLQVLNFHVPPVGTFHAKWMIVDGSVAVLNSNNIQDVPNMEMMVHYEGAIVDSFYDSAMITWNNALNPHLGVHKFFEDDASRQDFDFADRHTISESIGDNVNEETRQLRRNYLESHKNYPRGEVGRNGKDLVPFASQLEEPKAVTANRSAIHSKDTNILVGEHEPSQSIQTSNGIQNGNVSNGLSGESSTHPGPLKMGGSPVHGTQQQPDHSKTSTPPTVQRNSTTGHLGLAIATSENQDEVARVFGQDGDERGDGKLLADKRDAVQIEYDDTFSAEAIRVKGFLGTINKVTKHLNTSIQPNTKGTLLETDIEAHIKGFNPYILHSRHKPFPIAMVNRRPMGAPGHQSLRVPQNEAWIATLRLADLQVFIQTPDLNASDLVTEIPKTVKRGVEVVLYICLGYNDTGELLPFQNGTNEQIVCSLFKSLSTEEEKERLKVYWYTAKDMRTPVHAKPKRRTCHIKLMVADGHIGIQGSGNQDTQSWYHSQETNVMIDSKEVVSEWLWGIKSNQNTHIWGRVDNDGVWRSREGRDIANGDFKNGEGIPGALGGGKIRFGWAKGIKGAIERVQGVGGF